MNLQNLTLMNIVTQEIIVSMNVFVIESSSCCVYHGQERSHFFPRVKVHKFKYHSEFFSVELGTLNETIMTAFYLVSDLFPAFLKTFFYFIYCS